MSPLDPSRALGTHVLTVPTAADPATTRGAGNRTTATGGSATQRTTTRTPKAPTTGRPPARARSAADRPEQPVRRGRLRRPLSPRRRRAALFLAGALVVATGTDLVSQAGNAAAATASGSRSVSVASQLGLRSAVQDLSTPVATARLRELAASRAAREAQATAAAQTQAAAVQAAEQAAQQAAAEAARPKVVLPVPPGIPLTSGFGARWGTLHAGIDLAGPLGTPEYTAEDGVVLKAGPASGFGEAVYVQDAAGDVTVYGHMEKILVTAGQVVRAGDTIALMGAEGEATGSHLHFEVHVGGIAGQKIDPLPWLRERGVQI